jgi:hypothetical protein
MQKLPPPKIASRFTMDLDKDFQFRNGVRVRWRKSNALRKAVPDTPENCTTSETIGGAGLEMCCWDAFHYDRRWSPIFVVSSSESE